MKRLPNNYGGVSHLKDKKRKNPYMAWIPRKKIVSGKVQKKYYDDVLDVLNYIEGKDFINKEFRDDLLKVVNEYSKDEFVVKRTRVPIGYFPTRQDALNALAEYNRTPVDGELKNLTFNQIWEIIKPNMMSGITDSTKAHYLGTYKYLADIYDKKIIAIKTVDMQRCLDYVSKEAPSTQSKIVMICNAICNYAVEQDIVQKNYAQFLKVTSYDKGTKQPFTRDEIKSIWLDRDWRYETKKKSRTSGFDVSRVVLILLYTGMRIGELLAVKKEHVHIEERYIEVYGTKTENAERIVPIHKDIIELMGCSHYLVEDNNGDQVAYPMFQKMLWKAYREHMGFDHTIHETRHTFISLAQEHNLNQVMLRKMVGHSVNDVNEKVYTHISPEVLVAEIDKIVLTRC